jgi:large subunit ribosomal protein L25
MKLQVFERSVEKKRESKRIRRDGNIPAVVYLKDGSTHHYSVKGTDFMTALRQVVPGRLSTTVFELSDEKGHNKKVLVKDIQYHPTTYNVSHLDLEELSPEKHINVKIPIECTGLIDCIGVKLGGVVRQVIRALRVRCTAKDLVSHLELDVRDLNMGQYKRLSDLQIPSAMKPLMDVKEVAVVIVKR